MPYGSGTAAGKGYMSGAGESLHVLEDVPYQIRVSGHGFRDGSGQAVAHYEFDEFKKLKRVPKLITEIRRANAQG